MTAVAEPRPFAAAWRAAVAQATTRNRHQRALVLRFPAIAKRLTEPPLRLAEPQQWTGYIPGYWESEDKAGRVRPNTSPIRAQLAEILQAAAEAADQQTPAAPLDTDPMQGAASGITPPWRTR